MAIRTREASGRAIVQNTAAPAASNISVKYLFDFCGVILKDAKKVSSAGNGVCILFRGFLVREIWDSICLYLLPKGKSNRNCNFDHER